MAWFGLTENFFMKNVKSETNYQLFRLPQLGISHHEQFFYLVNGGGSVVKGEVSRCHALDSHNKKISLKYLNDKTFP